MRAEEGLKGNLGYYQPYKVSAQKELMYKVPENCCQYVALKSLVLHSIINDGSRLRV